MANRRHGELEFVENNMADVAAAELALARLWCHLRTWCRRPAVRPEEIDAVAEELREIETGLAAARRGLVVDRRQVE